MSKSLIDLISILDLEPLEENLFRGVSPKTSWQRGFGGQVIGQALVAACRTVENVEKRLPHSLHAYFLLPGDPEVPIAQGCSVRRAPVSSSSTNFYRTDCDASRGSSGSMNLFREDGDLRFAGMTISTGPTDDAALRGAPYDEQAGSVTTVLATDAAILAAGRELTGR